MNGFIKPGLWLLLVPLAIGSCAQRSVSNMPQESLGSRRNPRLAKVALQMLDRDSGRYDPERGKAYLEYALKHDDIKSLEVPTPVLIELLKSEKTATRKSRDLQEKLKSLKEIDLGEDS